VYYDTDYCTVLELIKLTSKNYGFRKWTERVDEIDLVKLDFRVDGTDYCNMEK
jgi:hypothetical protein